MMVDRQRYTIPPDATISDIDLDKEEFVLPDGRRLTEDLAEQIADDGARYAREHNLIPGGKSLSGDGSHSPVVQFRVPPELRDRALERANSEGVSLSRLAREALEHYLAS